MPSLATISEFEDELDVLAEHDPSTAGLIDALIEELGADHDLLEVLSSEVPKWHFLFEPSFEIKRFAKCWQSGRRVFVLKPYDENGSLIGYRIFIGYDLHSQEYFVLTVQPRATCYDTTTAEHRSLCDRYDRLGIATIERFR
jgi:hypothetical protein